MQRRVAIISVLVLIAATALALIVVGFQLYVRQDGTTVVSSPYGEVLIPNQDSFRSNQTNRQAMVWLSNRWNTSEQDIYMLVQDSEPWMQVIGLLDLRSLSSARVWILETSHHEGQRYEVELNRQAVPHDGNVYLISEYRPAQEIEKRVATEFYSTQTWGGFAIIEDISWTDGAAASGNILAYHSQQYLPSITIPITDGVPQKRQAYQTALIHD